MSAFVLQFIIKQWEKPQHTATHNIERQKMPDRYPLSSENTVYLFEQQCVLDYHGVDRLGDRLKYSRLDAETVQIDRFKLSFKTKCCQYVGAEKSIDLEGTTAQYQYDWRYRVYEGGFYYWLYEQVIVNISYTDVLNKNIFIEQPIALSFSDLTLLTP